jgi:hypothetical protein
MKTRIRRRLRRRLRCRYRRGYWSRRRLANSNDWNTDLAVLFQELLEIQCGELEVAFAPPAWSPGVLAENHPAVRRGIRNNAAQDHAVSTSDWPCHVDETVVVDVLHALMPVHADDHRTMNRQGSQNVLDIECPTVLDQMAELLDRLGSGQNRRARICLPRPVVELLSPVVDRLGIDTYDSIGLCVELVRPAVTDTRAFIALIKTFGEGPDLLIDLGSTDHLTDEVLQIPCIPLRETVECAFDDDPSLPVLDGVVDERARILSTHATNAGPAVVHHQVDMPGVGETRVGDAVTGLEHLADLDDGLLVVAVADVHPLLERPDVLEHLHLDDAVALGLERGIARSAETPPA